MEDKFEEVLQEDIPLEELLKEDLPQEDIPATPRYKPRRGGIMLSKPTYYALIVIFSLVILLSGIYLGGYLLETEEAESEYDMLASIYQQGMAGVQSTLPTQGSATGGSQETRPPTILPEMQPLYELNNDLVGYLHFPNGPNVNYPVMQSPYDEDFYLDHKFDRSPNGDVAVGCPYIPLSCDVNEPSDIIVINGHYLQDGGMFGSLIKFRDKSYWESHQTFRFDTLYERHTYRIFAVINTMAEQYDANGNLVGYPYHCITNFESKESFDQFIADVKGAAFTSGKYQGKTYFNTDITPQYGDKLLCLSTCDPSPGVDDRHVIIAVRID